MVYIRGPDTPARGPSAARGEIPAVPRMAAAFASTSGLRPAATTQKSTRKKKKKKRRGDAHQKIWKRMREHYSETGILSSYYLLYIVIANISIRSPLFYVCVPNGMLNVFSRSHEYCA